MKPSSLPCPTTVLAIAVRHEAHGASPLSSWIRIAVLAGSSLAAALILAQQPMREALATAPVHPSTTAIVPQAVPARTASEWLSIPR